MVVDVSADNDHVLQYFGLEAREAPTLRFINVETTKKYAPEPGALVTAAAVTDFCRMVLGGGVKVSSGLPTGWEQQLPGETPGETPGPVPLALSLEPGGPPRLGPTASQDPRGQEFRAGGF